MCEAITEAVRAALPDYAKARLGTVRPLAGRVHMFSINMAEKELIWETRDLVKTILEGGQEGVTYGDKPLRVTVERAPEEKARLSKFGDVVTTVQALVDEMNQANAAVPLWGKLLVEEQWRTCTVLLKAGASARLDPIADVISADNVQLRTANAMKHFKMEAEDFLAMVRSQRQNKQRGKK